jgi:beta-propeller repeat-containing protein
MKTPPIILLLFAVVLLACSANAQDSKPAKPSLLKARFGKLPICFIENRGVYPEEVKYYIQGADKTLFFTKNGITFRLKGKERGWVIKLEFVGAKVVEPRGEDRQQAVLSYFKGPKKEWKTGLSTYSRVVYKDLWTGIDLVYHGTVNQLKYEFVVAPGVDPALIRLRYTGASEVHVADAGGLSVETPAGGFQDAPPVAYQEINGKRKSVNVKFELGATREKEEGSLGFYVGDYDRNVPLVLDPALLVYCGYIGGSSLDAGYGIAVDYLGNVYVTGYAYSDQLSFPADVGPETTFHGVRDAYVAKFSSDGTQILYCGYIGGSGHDAGHAIAVDAFGNAYITGKTGSSEDTFPATQGTYNGGPYDAFLAKVNAVGTGLVYCRYIGGVGDDYGDGIALDAAGNVYVTGGTASDASTFPVIVGPSLTHAGGKYDAFVAKVKAGGVELDYCGYIGGSLFDEANDIVVDESGSVYVTGRTASTEGTFPVKGGPDLSYNGGEYDAFVAKVSANGANLDYCGYIGGSSLDWGHGISLDVDRNAYVAGWTGSSEGTFPVRTGPDLTYNGGSGDAFVAKVHANGAGLEYCGYVGGSGYERAYGVVVDMSGNAYMVGYTWSMEDTFPVKVGPDLTHNGGQDGFLVKVHYSGASLIYCGYLGGSAEDSGYEIAVDAAGSAYVTGETASSEYTFPVTSGPDVTFNGGGYDAFVAKVSRPILAVMIDVKPNAYPNVINLGSSGVIPVAILSSKDFDAAQVDPATVSLSGSGVAVRGKGSRLMASMADVNNDQLLDLVLHVETENLDPGKFQGGMAVLVGETFDHRAIQGMDEITIVP